MKIGANLNSLPINPKREVGVQDAPKKDAGSAKPSASSTAARVEMDLDPARLQRFVDLLKDMDPGDLHRVDELRQQVEGGQYQAAAGDMVDDLLAFLDDGRLET